MKISECAIDEVRCTRFSVTIDTVPRINSIELELLAAGKQTSSWGADDLHYTGSKDTQELLLKLVSALEQHFITNLKLGTPMGLPKKSPLINDSV